MIFFFVSNAQDDQFHKQMKLHIKLNYNFIVFAFSLGGRDFNLIL